MTLDGIDTIAVLGAGTMGHGIAEVAALAGYDVHLRDIEDSLVQEGIEEIEWSLDKLVEHDRITDEEASNARERVVPLVDVGEAVRSADVVIEAVPERLDIKRDVFKEVSKHAPESALFATNTSSLPVTQIAAATDRPSRCCGMHFFNPPVRMDLVEVIAGEDTDAETLDRIEALAEDFGKTPVRVNKDRPGFIVNRILTPLLNEAAWIVESGEATVEEVDATVAVEMGLPMGAFELADLTGIDIIVDVLDFIHEELGEPYAPAPLLQEKLDAQHLGQKTGQGFYSYENGGASYSHDAGSSDLAERFLAVIANETAKLLEEDVAEPPAIDTAMELGTGFPNGPARLADDHGIAALVATLEERHQETGAERYRVCETLRTLADSGFYGDTDTDDMGFDALRIEYPGEHVGEVVIDRPHRMNAISPAVLDELPRAISRFEDEDVRAILLRGAGDRAFSAGADVQGLSELWGDPDRAVRFSRRGQSVFAELEETDLPVIAAIDGFCLGGGMELATAADLRVASDRSTFGQTERNLGLIPGWGGTQRLAAIVGAGRAKEIILTGDRYEAEQLAEYGFLNEVYDAEAFQEAALEYAERIAAGPPIAQGLAKRAMNVGRSDRRAGLEVEAQSLGRIVDTEDLVEGVSAFLEDRDPSFTGE